MKQKAKKNTDIMSELQKAVSGLFVICMTGLFPLFYQDGYFNIANAKLMFFDACAAGLTALTLVFAIAGQVQKKGRQGKQKKQRTPEAAEMLSADRIKEFWHRTDVPARFMGAFVLVLLCSTICSLDPAESFYGTDARMLGALVFLLCAAVYVILGKYLQPGIWIAWIFLISNGLVLLLGILQFWGVNVFHLWDNMDPGQMGSFLTTIGNINACSSYYCMILPIGMVLYYLSETLFSKAIYGAFLVLGFYGAYATNASSWIPGIGTAFLVLLWFSMKDSKHMEKFLDLCLLFWGGSLFLKLTLMMWQEGNTKAFMSQLFLGQKLQNLMIHPMVLLTEGVLFGMLLCLVKTMKKKQLELPWPKIRNILFAILALLSGICIILVLTVNLMSEKQWTGTFQWINSLKLQDEFGSERGLIWRHTMTAWNKLPFDRKFIGCGPNCFHLFLYQYQGSELAAYGGRIVDPHNEWLLFLSITGVLGAVSYFGLLVGTAVSAGKRARTCPLMMVGPVMLGSYLAQGMVNNPTAFLTPNLFLFLGILKSLERHDKEKNSE